MSGPFASAHVSVFGLRMAVVVTAIGYLSLIDPDAGTGGLPCLWKLLFGVSCPGCGLTRAAALLLRGRIHDAAAMNWLIFPVVAVASYELFRKRRV